MIMANSRYPENGCAKAVVGENIIKRLFPGNSRKARSIHLHINAGIPVVSANGEVIKPEGGRSEYYYKHVVSSEGGESGGIRSLTIEGDATYYVEGSL
jgi:hypothetical protein